MDFGLRSNAKTTLSGKALRVPGGFVLGFISLMSLYLDLSMIDLPFHPNEIPV